MVIYSSNSIHMVEQLQSTLGIQFKSYKFMLENEDEAKKFKRLWCFNVVKKGRTNECVRSCTHHSQGNAGKNERN